ncbi:MAG: Gfo/Idh/MocA family oxidoreductase [Planctomycetes bacterium]|nr:Gfo/Idh/MocA family oxidoreductase [Planctomycetota bacterium]
MAASAPRTSGPPEPVTGSPGARSIGRRDLLRAAALAAPTIVSARALGLEPGVAAASERITLGVIGIGPRCRYVLGAMLPLPDVQCLAIADVQRTRRDAGKKLVDDHYGTTDCRVFRDFRELLDRPGIDAVLVATGDRWHGPASMLAAAAGKDVYSEKPCGISIGVCQRLADTFRRTGRIFQAGTQRRSVPNFIAAVELARSGKLGALRTLHASAYKPVLANDWLPAQPTPDRDECDWNLWLGPAPWRPFNQQYVDGKWRGYHDFDSGAKLLDWGAHTVDLCQWAGGYDGTTPVEFDPQPTALECRYADGVRLVIDFLPDPFGDRGPNWNTKLGTCPVKFVGDDGWVETGDAGGTDLSDEALRPAIGAAAKKIAGTDAALHARNFFDCVKSRQPTVCNADVMRTSHVACHAAALAWILGRPLRFDPVQEAFLTADGRPDHEADGLRSRPERDPFA